MSNLMDNQRLLFLLLDNMVPFAALLSFPSRQRSARIVAIAIWVVVSCAVQIFSSAAQDYNSMGDTPNNNKRKQKILLYVTTHMSPEHFWYLKACWGDALYHSSLLRNANVMVHMTAPSGMEKPALSLLNYKFRNQHLTVHVMDNLGGGW